MSLFLSEELCCSVTSLPKTIFHLVISCHCLLWLGMGLNVSEWIYIDKNWLTSSCEAFCLNGETNWCSYLVCVKIHVNLILLSGTCVVRNYLSNTMFQVEFVCVCVCMYVKIPWWLQLPGTFCQAQNFSLLCFVLLHFYASVCCQLFYRWC